MQPGAGHPNTTKPRHSMPLTFSREAAFRRFRFDDSVMTLLRPPCLGRLAHTGSARRVLRDTVTVRPSTVFGVVTGSGPPTWQRMFAIGRRA